MINTRHLQALALAWAAALPLGGPRAADGQLHYPTPEAAVQGLLAAVAAGPGEALAPVLGPDYADLGSGDPVADAAQARAFTAAATQANRVEAAADRATLLIGPDDWPFPIPLVKGDQGWRFDTAAGKDELFSRRIGRNELYAIATARAYVDAQLEYAARDPEGVGAPRYALHIRSGEGRRDGLYWPVAEGEEQSPLGPRLAEAAAEGYQLGASDGPRPYHGYYYRLLTAQGPAAPGGARSYLQDGVLAGGFALLAYPAEYGNSGIMTFLVNQDGVVFQQDLGPETGERAAAIAAYDPDGDWDPVGDP